MSVLSPEPVLTIRDVSKSYGKLQALDHMSFQVLPGEIFALLGPNGAGKTTLIGCITGLISQFSGEIKIADRDVRKKARITRQLVGLVPQELNFDGFFTVEQVLFYQSGFYNIRPDKKKIHKILNDFGLYEKRKVNTRALSGGMKRRLMICKALMHDPILLFLDEPTAGVDVELREELWRYVQELKKNGVTIFLTTHYLEEAEQLADRIGIINRGKLLMVKDREHILNEFGKRWNRFTVKNPIKAEIAQMIPPVIIPLTTAALQYASRIWVAPIGEASKSTIVPWIFPRKKENAELKNELVIRLIITSPGTMKSM